MNENIARSPNTCISRLAIHYSLAVTPVYPSDPPNTRTTTTTILKSGCTSPFDNHNTPVYHRQPASMPPAIGNPNGQHHHKQDPPIIHKDDDMFRPITFFTECTPLSFPATMQPTGQIYTAQPNSPTPKHAEPEPIPLLRVPNEDTHDGPNILPDEREDEQTVPLLRVAPEDQQDSHHNTSETTISDDMPTATENAADVSQAPLQNSTGSSARPRRSRQQRNKQSAHTSGLARATHNHANPTEKTLAHLLCLTSCRYHLLQTQHDDTACRERNIFPDCSKA